MKTVTYEITQHVAEITLNQPERHNAFDDAMITRLNKLLRKAQTDENVRVVVLQGAGKHFCAGADLAWMQRMANYDYAQNMQDAGELAGLMSTLYHFPKPTIAKISGAAYGGAVGLVACCDIAIATKLSKFCLSEVRLGLAPATIMPYVIDALGHRQARRYALSGEVLSARRARRLGLIHEAVNEDELDSTVASLIEHLCKAGPVAQAATKTLLHECARSDIDAHMTHKTIATIASLRVGSEGQEGLAAFFEKRLPSWQYGHDDD
jgi:methylglutaconyl-CoA hydratase